MFEANPKTGEIYDQFYRSPKLAQKYQNYYLRMRRMLLFLINIRKSKYISELKTGF